MFSLSAKLPVAPSVNIEKQERVYHPRTYSDFVKGLKNNELPQVVIKPNQNLAIMTTTRVIMEIHGLFRRNNFGKPSLRVRRML